MTNAEFSNQFDVLYNNVMSNQAPGLDEYEKSVFLTKAQNEIVLSYFNPKGNKYTEGFDGNERRQIDFSMLMKTDSKVNSTQDSPFANALFDPRSNSKSIALPTDVLVYVNEIVTVTRGANGPTINLTVVPISYEEYARQMSKPYKRPLQYQAWRLINTSSSTAKSDLVVGPNDTISKYIARYVKRPRAIILSSLEGTDVTLDGVPGPQTCELDPIIHEDILQRAVELAKAAYAGDLSSQVGLGNSSQTNLGVPAYGRGRVASE